MHDKPDFPQYVGMNKACHFSFYYTFRFGHCYTPPPVSIMGGHRQFAMGIQTKKNHSKEKLEG
jgi:hypothetical protein